jgi:single-strand DNA-binding protein
MSRSVNRVMLLGNVGSPPEIRATSSGTRIAKLSLATNRSWTDKAGQKQEKTEWHRCTFFGRLVDVVEAYVTKGDRLYVEGRIEYSQTEADGVTRYWCDIVVNELVMLGSDGAKGEQARETPPRSEKDDDLPFAPLRLTEPAF